MKGTFGNTVLQLTHAPTEDARLTCHAYYSNFPPTVPTAYFSAPAKLVEGFGGMPMSADDRLYWCAFQLENGSVTLAKTGIGLKASGLVSDNPITAGMAKSGCSKTSG
jgi:hypothetical protein